MRKRQLDELEELGKVLEMGHRIGFHMIQIEPPYNFDEGVVPLSGECFSCQREPVR